MYVVQLLSNWLSAYNTWHSSWTIVPRGPSLWHSVWRWGSTRGRNNPVYHCNEHHMCGLVKSGISRWWVRALFSARKYLQIIKQREVSRRFSGDFRSFRFPLTMADDLSHVQVICCEHFRIRFPWQWTYHINHEYFKYLINDNDEHMLSMYHQLTIPIMCYESHLSCDPIQRILSDSTDHILFYILYDPILRILCLHFLYALYDVLTFLFDAFLSILTRFITYMMWLMNEIADCLIVCVYCCKCEIMTFGTCIGKQRRVMINVHVWLFGV